MRISVTREHIRYGVKRSQSACPIAKAIRARWKWETVVVGNRTAWVGRRAYKLSQRAADFITAFDRGEDVCPSVFVLKERV